MPKTPCYLDGKLTSLGAQVIIEIETWNLGDIFFLFILNHMSPCPQKFENTQNMDHPNIYIYISGVRSMGAVDLYNFKYLEYFNKYIRSTSKLQEDL